MSRVKQWFTCNACDREVSIEEVYCLEDYPYPICATCYYSWMSKKYPPSGHVICEACCKEISKVNVYIAGDPTDVTHLCAPCSLDAEEFGFKSRPIDLSQDLIEVLQTIEENYEYIDLSTP